MPLPSVWPCPQTDQVSSFRKWGMKGRQWAIHKVRTGILSQTKLRDWAVRQAGAGCYSRAALSSNDSKTRYAFEGRPKCVNKAQ